MRSSREREWSVKAASFCSDPFCSASFRISGSFNGMVSFDVIGSSNAVTSFDVIGSSNGMVSIDTSSSFNGVVSRFLIVTSSNTIGSSLRAIGSVATTDADVNTTLSSSTPFPSILIIAPSFCFPLLSHSSWDNSI